MRELSDGRGFRTDSHECGLESGCPAEGGSWAGFPGLEVGSGAEALATSKGGGERGKHVRGGLCV